MFAVDNNNLFSSKLWRANSKDRFTAQASSRTIFSQKIGISDYFQAGKKLLELVIIWDLLLTQKDWQRQDVLSVTSSFTKELPLKPRSPLWTNGPTACAAGLGIMAAAVSLNPICKQIGSPGYPLQLLLAFEDRHTDNR